MRHLSIKSNFRRTLCAGVALAAFSALGITAAHAQTYPSKPIKFVVPFSAGSATDNVGRILAQAMGEAMGQTITVENKAGANGILGAEVVKAAPADGYTFLVTTSTTQAANVHLYRKLPYDPVKDFTPIGKIGETGFILMVTTDFPAKDMKEFVSYAKANPGKLAFGHGSSGSLVSAAMLTELAGLQTVNVPYKSIPPALTDLLGGQIQFAFADTGNAVSQMNGGRMRGLGVTT
jgi:tripartite-type tricarboxylate transporter receptor subunit TctC